MKVERDYLGKRYTFVPEDEKDEEFLEAFNKYIDELEGENKKLNNEIAWLKDHTKYNGITKEYYIDGTMTATEAKLRLQQAEDNLNYVSNLEEENRKLKLHIEAKDKAYTALLKDYEELKEDNKKLKAEIEEWLNAIRQKI